MNYMLASRTKLNTIGGAALKGRTQWSSSTLASCTSPTPVCSHALPGLNMMCDYGTQHGTPTLLHFGHSRRVAGPQLLPHHLWTGPQDSLCRVDSGGEPLLEHGTLVFALIKLLEASLGPCPGHDSGNILKHRAGMFCFQNAAEKYSAQRLEMNTFHAKWDFLCYFKHTLYIPIALFIIAIILPAMCLSTDWPWGEVLPRVSSPAMFVFRALHGS